MTQTRGGPRREDRIDITWDYEVCAWARHFNTSQQRVKEAVQAVGNRADRVREHLASSDGRRPGDGERPSAA
jgi:hypothetical protein